MFGFPRLRVAMATDAAAAATSSTSSSTSSATFTGSAWEQEDDITLVTLRRSTGGLHAARAGEPLVTFSLPGAIGNERDAMDRVARAVAPLDLAPARLERLKTAVAETVMNAIEYGSQGDPEVPVDVRVDVDERTIRIRVTDRALSGPMRDPEVPDLEAKLAGEQKARGWGLFLIRHMVDAMDMEAADGRQTVTLTIARAGQ